ncbi:MAG: TetR/AcrR family transcriptional regulator [bacterium]|nr:TetR/AcrR family transcriptional regulator [Gammaproteobacteria bacterium]HIL96722.1 TetR/AcrR family transcriptional regulator [Pseudomonadales bacterium]
MNEPQTKLTYHHGDLRQTLIDTAIKHLRESGADTLSLRALARQVGVSQTAPYRHFDSKNALFAAIAVFGLQQLKIELRRARDRHRGDHAASILHVGLAYIHWATQNPEKYLLLFDSSLVEFGKYPDLLEASNEAFAVLMQTIERGKQADLLIDRPTHQLAGAFWASVHGASSLLISKTGKQTREEEHDAIIAIKQLAKDPRSTLEFFLNSIRKPS